VEKEKKTGVLFFANTFFGISFSPLFVMAGYHATLTKS
jgi:hypothetical protein